MTDASTAAPGPGLNASQLRRNNPLRGIAFLCLGVLAFSFHDVAVKWVSGGYPLSEVLFVRSATAFPLMLGIVHLDAGLRSLLNSQFAVALVRALILLVAYLAYYMALSAMPLAEAVALYSSVPLIIVALAGPLLGEQIGIIRWVAVVVGFIGVIIMLRPGLGVFEPAGLLILFCALLYSYAMILGRRLGGIPASVMAFTSNGVFLLAGLAFGAVFSWLDLPASGHTAIDFTTRAWTVPGGIDLLLMMSCGVTAAIGIAGLTFAYREAEANLVASFEYTGLIWAIIWGLVIWGDVPRATTLAGAVLIVGAGLVALAAGGRREVA